MARTPLFLSAIVDRRVVPARTAPLGWDALLHPNQQIRGKIAPAGSSSGSSRPWPR